MDFNKKIIKKCKSINPLNIKENNINLCNNYDYSFRTDNKNFDGFELVTKVKRNFK